MKAYRFLMLLSKKGQIEPMCTSTHYVHIHPLHLSLSYHWLFFWLSNPFLTSVQTLSYGTQMLLWSVNTIMTRLHALRLGNSLYAVLYKLMTSRKTDLTV